MCLTPYKRQGTLSLCLRQRMGIVADNASFWLWESLHTKKNSFWLGKWSVCGPREGAQMSSFHRLSSSEQNVRSIPGTKAWINQQTLTSSGNKDLDGLLGGGLCLGTMTLLEEDRFSSHALTLTKYFLAQGLHLGHRCLVVGAEGVEVLEDFLKSLPFDLSRQSVGTCTKEGSNGEAGASSARQQPDARLKIAWQYGKYLGGQPGMTNGGAGGPRGAGSFCSSFDLSRPIQSDLLESCPPQALDLSQHPELHDQQYQVLYQALAACVAGLPPGVALRVVIRSFMAEGTDWNLHWPKAVHFLHSLKALICSAPVAVMVTIRSHHLGHPTQSMLLQRLADTVIQVDSFSGKRSCTPPEFADFAGLLYVKASQHVNGLAPHARGTSNKFGIKRDRRKLHIEPLHLPPEGIRELTDDVERQRPLHGQRQVGSGCASTSGPGATRLDF